MNRRIIVALGIHLVGIALTAALAHTAIAQGAVHPAALATPIGTWRGTSSCLVRPSGCHDEIVVYRITPMKAADSLSIDAFRIVRGEELDMGVLGCRLVPPSGQITCTIPQGVWRFTVRGDSLTGELRLPDNTRFRDVRAIRARGP